MIAWLLRISSQLSPITEQAASASFELLADVTQVEILQGQGGTYDFIGPTTIPTSRDVEAQSTAAAKASKVLATNFLDPPVPSGKATAAARQGADTSRAYVFSEFPKPERSRLLRGS